MSIEDRIFGMSSAAREVMRCLFFHGPTQDGNIPSKQGRTELIKLEYVREQFGHAWLTNAGVEYAIKSMGLDEEKEAWQRKRSAESSQNTRRGMEVLADIKNWGITVVGSELIIQFNLNNTYEAQTVFDDIQGLLNSGRRVVLSIGK